MMSAACELCGELVFSGKKFATVLDFETQAKYDLQEFDLLAASMSQHLFKHPQEHREMMAVMALAGKVYAMKWGASTITPNFERLRESWRAGIFDALDRIVRDQTIQPAASPAEASDSSEGEPGSNVKKSARKDSN